MTRLPAADGPLLTGSAVTVMTQKKPSLGRGLNALMGATDTPRPLPAVPAAAPLARAGPAVRIA